MINKTFKTLLIFAIFLMPVLVKAQPNINEDPNYGVEDVHVPIDDGVGLFVGVAILYGLLRVRAHRKNQKNSAVLFES